MMRRMQLAGIVAFMLLALGTIATHVTAYATNGHAWGVAQVPYYINPQNRYLSETSAVAAITSGAAAWAGVTNVNLVYSGYTTDSSLTLNHVNEVFFRDDSSGYIAETYWWYDGTGHLVDADTVFHENYRFYSGNMGCNGDGYYAENTAAHEFGHVLGLAHSAVELATMWPSSGVCETLRETLDPDDIAGLQSLYPSASSPTPAPTAPAAPSQLTVSIVSGHATNSLALRWTDGSTNETGYTIERSPDLLSFTQIAQLGVSATSYIDSGLPSGAAFYYRVRAYNNVGASPYSNTAAGQTQVATTPTPIPVASAPAAPSSPTPGDGTAGVATNLVLGWTATGALSYDVYLNGAPIGKGLTSSSVRASSLAAGSKYSWQVVATNAAGSTTGPTWTFVTKVKGNK